VRVLAASRHPAGQRLHGSREALTGILLLLPAFSLALSFTLFPVFYNIWMGFYEKHSLTPDATWVGFGNYLRMLEDAHFWTAVRLGVTYALGSTVLQIVTGLAGALVLHSLFPGRNFLRGLALFPYMLPTIISVGVWRWMLNDLYGFIPYVLGLLGIPGVPVAWLTFEHIMWVLILLSVWIFFPFVTVNVLARLQTIPPELYDAARVDGASRVGQFIHVTLPQIKNVLLIVILLRGIFMFTKFDVPWLLGFGAGAGEGIRTLPVFTYQWAFTQYQAGMGAALSNVMFAMLLAAVTIYLIAFPAGEEA
jgi:multiple sugar transport system permease protein